MDKKRVVCEFTCRENNDQGCPFADGKTEIKRSKKLSKGAGHLKVRESGDETIYKPWRPKAQRSSWTGCLLEDDGEAGVLQAIQKNSVAVASDEREAKANKGTSERQGEHLPKKHLIWAVKLLMLPLSAS